MEAGLKKLGPFLMPLAMLLVLLACAHMAVAQEAANDAGAKSASPSFLGTLETTWEAWRTWLRSLSPYLVAGLGGAVAYGIGVMVFFAAFGLGSYAPMAARSGLWVFALIWFVLLATVFIPLSSPWWWWLVAFSLLIVILAMIPKPRAVS